MNLDDVEAVVRDSARVAGLTSAASRMPHGYIRVALHGHRADEAQAYIETNGVEMFLLRLDERYDLREFDWEPEGQREVLQTLVSVAAAHFRGQSRLATQKRPLRRGRDYLEVVLDGETYRSWA